MKAYAYIAGFWCAVLLGAWIWMNMDVQQPPGVLAPDDPRQLAINERSWDRGDAHFTAIAQFDLRARVLSSNHYQFDAEADISPVDLALGWGRMSDSAILDELSIKQSGRCYFWRPKWGHDMPLPVKEIVSHSANMHMIPANDAIARTLDDVRPGEVVALDGYLVQVNKPHGWVWKTSTTRTDLGMGACEVVWVERAAREASRLERASR
jgi:hypothetical protein